jgi:uncharacterized protein with HEPN domain
MSRSDDSVRLRHILDAATTAIAILDGRSLPQLRTSERDRLAIERLLEIVGEAANHVDPTTMARLDSLPWRDMIDMRNVVIHAYFDIELETVWKTVADDLPAVVAILRAEFDSAPNGDG